MESGVQNQTKKSFFLEFGQTRIEEGTKKNIVFNQLSKFRDSLKMVTFVVGKWGMDIVGLYTKETGETRWINVREKKSSFRLYINKSTNCENTSININTEY